MKPTPLKFRTPAQHSTAYMEAEALVSREYARHFGSGHHHMLPSVLTATCQGTLVGCVGYGAASASPLFLEQYLDTSVEAVLDSKLGRPIKREQVVEIGGFAVVSRKYVLPLFHQLATTLLAQDFEVAVCTVTGPVSQCLRSMGIEAIHLADATPDRLPDGHQWGSYYSLAPVVMAGDIQRGVAAIGACR